MAAKRKYLVSCMKRIYEDVKKVDEEYGCVKGGSHPKGGVNPTLPQKMAKKKALEDLVYKYQLKSINQMRSIARDYVRRIKNREQEKLHLEIKDEKTRQLWWKVNTMPWRKTDG